MSAEQKIKSENENFNWVWGAILRASIPIAMASVILFIIWIYAIKYKLINWP